MLWNIDLTLIDVARVTRAAYAEAFEKVTGEPLVYLTSTSGRTDSEMFFEFCARNNADTEADSDSLADFLNALEESFAHRRADLLTHGRAMPGAQAALAAVAGMDDTVQTAVTGTIMANAVAKLEAFGMDRYLNLDIGGFGSVNYPKASLIQSTRMRAAESCGADFPESATVYITDAVHDVRAAVIGQAVPIALLSGAATEGQLRAAGAEHVLEDLTDPQALLRTIRAATSGTGPVR